MRIGIVGGGAIGGYLAVELGASGFDTELLVRSAAPNRAKPVKARRADGRCFQAGPSLRMGADPGRLSGVEICFVAVKSEQTSAVGAALVQVLPSDTLVISLQNGLDNAKRLQTELGARALASVVTYNVFSDEDGQRVQATAGKIIVDAARAEQRPTLKRLRGLLRRAGETLELSANIEAAMAGKLLLNLNNGVGAATGLGIAEMLATRDARWCFARCIAEGLDCMRAAGLKPARVAPLPAWTLVHVLKLPDAVVMRFARALLAVDRRARSSTLQDLDDGRSTEIDQLNGAIVRLAQRVGRQAPINQCVTEVVHRHERSIAAGGRPDFLSPRALRETLESLR